MLHEEAIWIGQFLRSSNCDRVRSVLNIGSSTGEFRTRTQPYIDREIFAPLASSGVEVIHCDLKAAPGVTLRADILDAVEFETLRDLSPDVILCSNLFEHVDDVGLMADRLQALVGEGARLVVTAPASYPYHPDPIDNGFRPDESTLAALFPELRILDSAIICGCTYGDELKNDPSLVARRALRSVLPFPPGLWLSTLDRWRWLWRPYKAACVGLARRSDVTASRAAS